MFAVLIALIGRLRRPAPFAALHEQLRLLAVDHFYATGADWEVCNPECEAHIGIWGLEADPFHLRAWRSWCDVLLDGGMSHQEFMATTDRAHALCGPMRTTYHPEYDEVPF